MLSQTPDDFPQSEHRPDSSELNFGGLYRFRASHEPIEKTGVLTTDDLDRSFGLSQAELEEFCNDIPTHRPLIPDPASLSPSRPPSYRLATTPGGTKLRRVHSAGPLAVYSDRKITSPLKPNTPSFYTVDDSAVLPAPTSGRKYQEFKLTQEIYKTICEQRQSKKSRRRSQSTVMGKSGKKKEASANKEAELLGLEHQRNFEWLHLIAHFMRGMESQVPENLVGGTDAANTSMMFIEEQIPKLLATFSDGVIIKVAADLLPETHFASTIYYSIEIIQPTGDSIPFKTFIFNALTTAKPSIVAKSYTEVYFSALMKKVAEQLQVGSQERLEPTPLTYDDESSDDEHSESKSERALTGDSTTTSGQKRIREDDIDSDAQWLAFDDSQGSTPSTEPSQGSTSSTEPNQSSSSFTSLLLSGLFGLLGKQPKIGVKENSDSNVKLNGGAT
ncbi:MAG: hypothetical protein AB7F64_01235 [Gammaproteobacteria bacterium]